MVGSQRASVKDVAARAGVSLGTVSNVLNRPEVVAERTRKRVLAAIAELGHRLLHPRPGRRADPVGSVEHVGDRSEGHAGARRDVLDGRAP